MSKVPGDLLYTDDDEWVRMDGQEATVGITDHAQDALSDIVFVELPDEGDFFGQGETFGVVESVKAAADLYMPVSGTVTAVNNAVVDAPELINNDPYGEGWLIKLEISNAQEKDKLYKPDAYSKKLEDMA